ncbi:MAG TPA: hypothetical protein VH988_27725 [Thermoanaerobaculia bacterium]|nr:hypothetical protein [Thermoanaerobaculia bacterium]
MTRPAKVLTIIAIILLALPVGCGLLLAGSVVTSGLVTVKVHETKPGGTNVYVPVPAGLIYLGLDVLPLLDRNHGMDKARREMGAWAPVAAAAMQSLEDCPDAVLVDVQDHNETVKIVKTGRSIEIQVHDNGEDVHISFPAHLFSRVAHQLV